VLLIGNVHLIGLCESQGHVVCRSLLLQPKNIIIIIIIIIITIISIISFLVLVNSPFPASSQLQLAAFCLVFLQAVMDGDLLYMFLHALCVFSSVTIFISKFIQTSIYI
jgi:hypothetical protein